MTMSLTFSGTGTQRGMRRRGGAQASVPFLAAALIAIAMPAWAGEKAAPPALPKASIDSPAGIFTGEFVNGAPVYRLPPIDVVAHRHAELARMQREESAARAGQARVKPTAQPQAQASDARAVLREKGLM